jgi:hypothetical protein
MDSQRLHECRTPQPSEKPLRHLNPPPLDSSRSSALSVLWRYRDSRSAEPRVTYSEQEFKETKAGLLRRMRGDS